MCLEEQKTKLKRKSAPESSYPTHMVNKSTSHTWFLRPATLFLVLFKFRSILPNLPLFLLLCLTKLSKTFQRQESGSALSALPRLLKDKYCSFCVGSFTLVSAVGPCIWPGISSKPHVIWICLSRVSVLWQRSVLMPWPSTTLISYRRISIAWTALIEFQLTQTSSYCFWPSFQCCWSFWYPAFLLWFTCPNKNIPPEISTPKFDHTKQIKPLMTVQRNLCGDIMQALEDLEETGYLSSFNFKYFSCVHLPKALKSHTITSSRAWLLVGDVPARVRKSVQIDYIACRVHEFCLYIRTSFRLTWSSSNDKYTSVC